jgi:hypothetical protein
VAELPALQQQLSGNALIQALHRDTRDAEAGP